MDLKPLSRSVSIIGVGTTVYGTPFDTEELKDLSFQDYGAWAVLAALDDAGVNPREVDHLVVGSTSSPLNNAMNISPHHGFLEWCGMKGKSANYQVSGCSTGFNIITQAIDLVAGGRCDIAVACSIEINQSITHPNQPSHIRYPFSQFKELYGIEANHGTNGVDTSYARWTGSTFSAMDHCGRHYMRDAGITYDDLEDANIGSVITSRHMGALGDDTYLKQPFEDIAKEYGFDDVNEYMKSDMDPKFGDFNRVNFTGIMCEGAGAIVICASDIARRYQKKPVEVVNMAQCDYSVLTPNNLQKMTRVAAKRIYEATGYKPEDIEYFQCTNMDQNEMIDACEAVGYMPKGEAWKYFRDGKTAFDGEKPVNTDGGTQGVGHAYSATSMHNYKEAVLQIRGEAGKRQIPNPPKVVMVRGEGATHSTHIAILRPLAEDAPVRA